MNKKQWIHLFELGTYWEALRTRIFRCWTVPTGPSLTSIPRNHTCISQSPEFLRCPDYFGFKSPGYLRIFETEVIQKSLGFTVIVRTVKLLDQRASTAVLWLWFGERCFVDLPHWCATCCAARAELTMLNTYMGNQSPVVCFWSSLTFPLPNGWT